LFVAFLAASLAISLLHVRPDLPLTPDALRDAIRAWGPLAPIIFTGAFALRPFFFFPSTLLFLAAGLAFGVGWGTVYAAIGGTVGAVIGFTIARKLGHEFVQAQLGDRLPKVLEPRWGVGLVFLLNMVPIGPLTVVNYGAGLSGMRLVPFTCAVFAGLTPRAFAYSFFGHSLLNVRSKEFALAIGLLAALVVIPLIVCHYVNQRTDPRASSRAG